MRSHEANVAPNSDYYIYTASLTAQKLFLYPTYVGYFEYLPGYRLYRSSYDSFLIMLITSGRCLVTCEGITTEASEGSLVLIDCYRPHSYGTDTGWSALWMHYDGIMARPYYEQIVQTMGNVIVPANFQDIRYNLDKIYRHFRSGDAINEPRISTRITAILNNLLTDHKAHPSTCPILRDTITYINEHFAEPIHLKELAQHASLSPFYFTRMFTKETGMTPYQYLIATRLSFAKLLLKTTDYSIKEIAFHSGFASESQFCSSFKKREKITPSSYRLRG